MEVNPKLRELKDRANTLPLSPGVYIMKDKNAQVIYIGKAKALKNRVTQYFGSPKNHNEKVRRMVLNVDAFDTILCDSEFEAFILENSLIKQYQPKYNILLKDDKGFHYVHITEEKWRKIEWVKSKGQSGKYIGPFNSGTTVRNTVQQALKIFRLPDCHRSFDKISKPCLNYSLHLCDAPCRGKISLAEYNASLDAAVRFIRNGGCQKAELDDMKKKMEEAAEKLEFEYAARLRDRIRAVERISEKQKVIGIGEPDQDVFAIAAAGNLCCVQLLKFRGGLLCDQNHFILEEYEGKNETYNAFLPQYYSSAEDIPGRITVEEEFESMAFLETWLTEKRRKKVTVVVPKIGQNRKLTDLCLQNAAEALSKRLQRTGKETSELTELAELLGMKQPPRVIESYDISNTGGEANVASMVVFADARPNRAHYRKFKIRTFSGQDDYRSMAEVLDRRFCEYEKQNDEAFSTLPDLILLDGGRGQISAVLPVLARHGITVPLFGMVKDSHHRTRAIASTDGEIAIKPTRRVFTLITKIQDETHRFAVAYHHTLHKKNTLQYRLTQIPGIGPKKAAGLLRYFKTMQAVRSATPEQLEKVPGLSARDREEIVRYFQNE